MLVANRLKAPGFLMLMLALAAIPLSGCQRKSGQNEAAKPTPAPPPARVLVRTYHKENAAADGYLWLAAMWIDQAKKIAETNKALAEKVKSPEPDYRNSFGLSSDDSIKVTEEATPEDDGSGKKAASPTPSPAKPSPNDYDFLVTWETTFKEHTKRSFSAPLKISVEESVWVERLAGDPRPVTWSISYELDGGSDISAYTKTAAEQNEKVVIPKRSGVIKELREFILKPR